MHLRILNIFLFIFLVIMAFSCKSDSANTTANSEIIEPVAETTDSHAGHDHAGHDHEIQETSSNTSTTAENKTVNKALQTNESPQVSSKAKNTDGKSDMEFELDQAKGTVPPDVWMKKKQAIERAEAQPDPKLIVRQQVKTNLPSACSLIDEKTIGRTIGVSPEKITLKDGSSRKAEHSQSCFFRWEHKGIPNSGVLIQIQDNPIPDEFPDWASAYVAAKINQGEQMPDGSGSYRYKRMDGLGDSGGYSAELDRYVWRVGKDYVFMVAFNLSGESETQKLNWVKSIGTEMMNNLK